MNAFSNIDMAEVTRLTRAGRLGEALSLLRGLAGGRAEAEPDAQAAPSPFSSLRGLTETVPGLAGLRSGLRGLFDTDAEAATAPTPAGARFEERVLSGDAGPRSYKVYVPSGYRGQALPVVVMLHGCTQDPDDFAAGTRMNEVAEEQTFLVVYPRQPQSANLKKCWNWFEPGEQTRDRGEPASIAAVARAVVSEFSADPARVYVAGLSAGGAAAAILAANYPDVFAAAGVHSGLACGAARDMASAFAAMNGQAAPAPALPSAAAPTIVFHGDADRTVHVVNAERVAAQARPDGELERSVTHGQTPDGRRYTRTVELDAGGREAAEQWVLHGAGHAWSGGSAAGSFADTRGPDASREMVRFFLKHEIETAASRPATKRWRLI